MRGPGMPSALLLESIRQDHESVLGALRRWTDMQSGDERARARDEIVRLMRSHVRLENDVIYAALGRIGSAAPLLGRMARQHERLDHVAAMLEALAPENAALDAGIDLLTRLFNAHAEEEAQTVWPKLERHLRPDLDSLAIEYEDARQRERGAYGV
jgi:hypothetical protein